MPASVIAGVLAKGEPTNPSALPSDVFDTCTPTSGSQAVIKVTQKSCEPQKWLALDVIGTYGLLTTVFSIDQLPLWVYAVDGEYITPQLVNAMTITNGDRFSVLVNLTTPGDYTMRHASASATQIMEGTGTLSFRAESGAQPFTNPTTPYIAKNALNTTADVKFFNQAQQKAFPPQPIAQSADATYKLALRVAGQSYNWALNGTIFPPAIDSSNPILFAPQANLQNNVTITTTNGTWVDLILVTATWPMPPHPIHKHGNKMYLLGEGQGYFNWTTVAEAAAAMPSAFNFVDPPVRDGFATPQAVQGPAWMVVRYHVTNPGAWLLHCHIQSHLLGGMAMVIQDGVDAWPSVPAQYLNYQ
jgi:FtsP/CotA-like multicopper oxidase with cupredoxin domain